MPALIDIRRRIRSVKNTQQITRAMKMVSAAKLRRSQEAMFAARPFARKMAEVLSSLADRADPDAHSLLQEHEGSDRTLLVVVTADKGLCGGFNANIIRAATAFLESNRDKSLSLELVGRKGRDFFKRRNYRVRSEHVGLLQALSYPKAQAVAQDLIKGFTAREFDRVYLLYNEFKSVMQQSVIVAQLLPIERHEVPEDQPPPDYLYEPAPGAIFDHLLPRHVEMQIWRAFLESTAAEHGARMTAMDAASRNASDMIDNLTLYMNKIRQAAITKEIIEVVSGSGSA